MNRIVNGRSGVTAEMALKPGAAFGTSLEFRLNAQKACNPNDAVESAGPLPEPFAHAK